MLRRIFPSLCIWIHTADKSPSLSPNRFFASSSFLVPRSSPFPHPSLCLRKQHQLLLPLSLSHKTPSSAFFSTTPSSILAFDQLEEAHALLRAKKDDEALLLVRPLAEQENNAHAQFLLGIMYIEGKCVPKDFSLAHHWSLRSSQQGFHRAYYNLAMLEDNGLGCEKNPAKAVEWYLKAAEHDDEAAQNRLGEIFYYGLGVKSDRENAIHFWKLASEGKMTAATHQLAKLFDRENKPAEAFPYWERLASHNHGFAQFELAGRYLEGLGIPTNLDQSRHYLQLAAQNGHRKSVLLLADMYRTGSQLVEKNLDAAVSCMKSLSDGDDDQAMIILGLIHYDRLDFLNASKCLAKEKAFLGFLAATTIDQPTSSEMSEPEILANRAKILKPLADAGCPGAHLFLGQHCLRNLHSPAEAFRHMTVAAESGEFHEAHHQLGRMYRSGIGCQADLAKALHHIHLAIKGGSKVADGILGDFYLQGIGLAPDKHKAF